MVTFDSIRDAIIAKDDAGVKKLLTATSSLVLEKDASDTTLLHIAVSFGSVETIKLLLSLGADIRAVDNGIGSSVLLLAVYRKRFEVVKLLIEHTPDIIFIVDRQGQSALEYAIRVDDVEMIKLLLALNSNIIKATVGGGLIQNAVIIGNEDVVKLLLGYPEILNTIRLPNSAGFTALFFAQSCSRYAIVKILKSVLKTVPPNEGSEDFIKKCEIVSEVGNILGLDGNIDVRRRDLDTLEQVDFTGSVSLAGVRLFEKCITAYCNTLSAHSESQSTIDYFAKMKTAILEEADYLSFDNSPEEGVEKILNDIKQNKLIVLSTERMGHACAFAIYKNYFILCDRVGDYSDVLKTNRNTDGGGTKIYEIDPVKTEHLLALTTMKPLGIPLFKEEYVGIFSEITAQKKPIVILPSKCQKHDNCTFIHQKSITEGILYLLKREALENSNIASSDVDHLAREYAEKTYKIFTAYLRTMVVEKQIHERQAILAKLNEQIEQGDSVEKRHLEEDLSFYTDILVSIVNEHHGQPAPRKEGDIERRFVLRENKVKEELKNATAILTSFDLKTRENLKTKINFDVDAFLSLKLGTTK
jgi:hypothetical protein